MRLFVILGSITEVTEGSSNTINQVSSSYSIRYTCNATTNPC